MERAFYPFYPGDERSKEELDRSKALNEYAVLSPPPERSFQEIVEAASIACRTPFASISFLDGAREKIKASIGLALNEIPRTESFCHFCLQNEGRPLEIPEVLEGELVQKNPLVLDHPYLRFYAGAPILTPERISIGCLSVMDQRSRTLSSEQRRMLELLGEQLARIIELRGRRLSTDGPKNLTVSQRVVKSEVEERKRIGQDLHDGVVQTLAAASMHVDLVRDPERNIEERSRVLDNLKEMLDQVVSEIRGIGRSLMGKEVRTKGLKEALHSLSDRYEPLEEAPDVETRLDFDDQALDPAQAINLYRVAQEFIQNSVKHSGASQILLHADQKGQQLRMRLEDDGSGLSQDPDPKKAIDSKGGLRNMKDRIHSLGGKCDISSSPGKGMRVQLELQLDEGSAR